MIITTIYVLVMMIIATIIVWICSPINTKCPIWQDCKHYRKGNSVCNKTRGDYYGIGRKCGSYYNRKGVMK